MSKNRFEGIMSVLHISDHTTDKDQQGDPLRKVRFLVDAKQERCMDLGQPNQHVSLDEHMVKAKGHFSFRYVVVVINAFDRN